MNYVGKLFTTCKHLYNDINAATLTGAIDVIVVEQEDGSLLCSPFHVRFGKLGVLNTKEKTVDICVNSQPVSLTMKLSDAGVAYFEEENQPSASILSDVRTEGDVTCNEATHESPPLSAQPSPPRLRRTTSLGSVSDLIGGDGHHSHQRHGSSFSSSTLRHAGSTDSELSFKSVITYTADGETAPLSEERFSRQPSELLEEGEEMSLPPSSEDASVEEQQTQAFGVKPENQLTNTVHWPEQGSSLIVAQTAGEDTQLKDKQAITVGQKASHELEISKTDIVEGVDEPDCAVYPEKLSDLHPFSDGDVTPPRQGDSAYEADVGSFSDSELSWQQANPGAARQLSWTWGKLPSVVTNKLLDRGVPGVRSRPDVRDRSYSQPAGSRDEASKSFLGSVQRWWRKDQQQDENDSLYLSELNLEKGSEVASRYLTSCHADSEDISHGHTSSEPVPIPTRDSENDSGTASLPSSPPPRPPSSQSMTTPEKKSGLPSLELEEIMQPGHCELSLCGGLKDSDGDKEPERFAEHRVGFEEFCKKPDLLSSSNLVVRIGTKYYNWQVAAPLLVSLVVFQTNLPEKPRHMLMKQHMPKKRRFAWPFWRGSESSTSPAPNSKSSERVTSNENTVTESAKPEQRVRWNSYSSDDDVGGTEEAAHVTDDDLLSTPQKLDAKEESVEVSGSHDSHAKVKKILFDPWKETLPGPNDESAVKKTLRLSSEHLEQLNLQPGPNTITFSITTKYQGTSSTDAIVYRWRYDDKVVVSDIDGTITKSDVYGQLLPWFGRDWSQGGVAELFSRIESNGYKFVYLSARAICQSRITRDYLHGLRQGKLSLPQGPVLLNPASLINAFRRELILRTPEEFKIAVLRDLSSLFGKNDAPYVAGFGNKPSDACTYNTVGIPKSRTFTVNHRGELSQELLCTYRSSYNGLRELADHVFPSLDEVDGLMIPVEYNSFNFWRQPPSEIDLELL